MPVSGRFTVESTLVLLLVGFLALLGIVGMTFWLGERSQVYFSDVIEARDTRGAAVELRNALQTAESGQRGFLFTGNEIYLAPYGSAKTLAQRELAELTRLLKPYRQSDVTVRRLTAIIGEKFAEMDQTIDLKRARRDADVTAMIRTNRGKALMDEANVFFSGVIRGADERLTTGVAEQRGNATWLRSFAIISAIVIIAVIGGAAVSILRYTRELRQARDEVGVLNSELEFRVRARTADLVRANEEIQRFAYIVTHDLRAPLISIMGFTSELEGSARSVRAAIDGWPGDAADPIVQSARTAVIAYIPEAVGFIRSSAAKMDSLIGAILRLSREGRRMLKPETFDLNDIVRASVAAVQHQVIEANGEIDLDIDAPPIVSDRLSFEQILGNLLDNAVKYRSKERRLHITIRASASPNGLLGMEIADNGRGIAEADLERIFELFSRVGARDQPGEGMGLAHVRTVVRNLGGEISVTSALDEGTTFRIVVPLKLHVAEGFAA